MSARQSIRPLMRSPANPRNTASRQPHPGQGCATVCRRRRRLVRPPARRPTPVPQGLCASRRGQVPQSSSRRTTAPTVPMAPRTRRRRRPRAATDIADRARHRAMTDCVVRPSGRRWVAGCFVGHPSRLLDMGRLLVLPDFGRRNEIIRLYRPTSPSSRPSVRLADRSSVRPAVPPSVCTFHHTSTLSVRPSVRRFVRL